MSIQINESDWRPMTTAMIFPALVQYADGMCVVYNEPPQAALQALWSSMLRWMPFTPPPLPVKNAFEEWLLSQGFQPAEIYAPNFRSCWSAATEHALKQERQRVAEQVEGFTDKYFLKEGVISRDLRKLAAGENVF